MKGLLQGKAGLLSTLRFTSSERWFTPSVTNVYLTV